MVLNGAMNLGNGYYPVEIDMNSTWQRLPMRSTRRQLVLLSRLARGITASGGLFYFRLHTSTVRGVDFFSLRLVPLARLLRETLKSPSL